MNCTQFLESLNCYVDGELPAAVAAEADLHRRACQSCRGAVTSLLEVREALKQVAAKVQVPTALEERVRAAIAPQWLQLFAGNRYRASLSVIGVAALGLLVVSLATARFAVDIGAADAMDRLAVGLDDSSAVVVEGTVLCRDCELEHRYGIKASCQVIGHHGAIFTADGRVLNLVEQPSSTQLIHDEALFGRKVIVRGRLFRGARALVVESYELEG